MKVGCVSRIKVNGYNINCGRCYFCRQRKVDGWALRLSYEMVRPGTQSYHFVTMTYNNNSLPFSENGLPTLDKKHLKTFLETLKKYNKRHKYPPVKYYAVGEYGSSKHLGRPHYHAIIFNVHNISRFIDTWKYGHVHIGADVGTSTVGYIADYVWKSKKVPAFERDDRQKEFSLISNSIGSNYLTPEMIEYHQKNFFDTKCHIHGSGKRVAMPRYYQQKIFSEKERIQRAAYISQIVPEIEEVQRLEVEERTEQLFENLLVQYVEQKHEQKIQRANQRKSG